MYLILASAFFMTVIFGVLLILGLLTNFRSRPHFQMVLKGYGAWLVIYTFFITFFTGPIGDRLYRHPSKSPYKLPWKSGISRFVSQGNRSFTSHRDQHLYAWDFWMEIGSEILAARAGVVKQVEASFDGIGLHSNFVLIEHEDGTKALYAHIRKNGSVVNVGDHVGQGDLIAYSGMVGQTINPHLHFVVFDRDGPTSLPILFSDVPDGLPVAGKFYQSANDLGL